MRMTAIMLTIIMVVVVALGIEWCGEYAVMQEAKTNPNLQRIGNHIVRSIAESQTRWNPSTWTSAAEYSDSWKRMRNAMKEKMLDLSVVPDANYAGTAIVHFRCSDVPFIDMPEYPLQPRAYFKFVADFLMKYNDVLHVLIVNCNKHNWHQLSPLCHSYAYNIKSWLQEYLPNIPVDVDLACETQKMSLEKMLGSHTLISTGGSFSFVPGILKGKRFVTPYLGGSMQPYHSNLHRLVHWTMWDSNAPVHSSNYERFNYSAT